MTDKERELLIAIAWAIDVNLSPEGQGELRSAIRAVEGYRRADATKTQPVYQPVHIVSRKIRR